MAQEILAISALLEKKENLSNNYTKRNNKVKFCPNLSIALNKTYFCVKSQIVLNYNNIFRNM